MKHTSFLRFNEFLLLSLRAHILAGLHANARTSCFFAPRPHLKGYTQIYKNYLNTQQK
jgi:hypothetical protein